MAADGRGAFALSGADAAFGSRTKGIFAELDSIEAKHVAHENTPSARQESASLMKPDPDIELQESAKSASREADDKFRMPGLPAKKRARTEGPSAIRSGVPGHVTCPSKWTKYDLSDVSASDLSESSNVGAAMDFLRSRPARSVGGEPKDDDPMEEETISSGASAGCNAVGGIRHKFHRPAGKASNGMKSSVGSDTANSGKTSHVAALSAKHKDREEADDSDDVVVSVQSSEEENGGQRAEISSTFVHNRARRGRSSRPVRYVRDASDSDDDDDQERGKPTTVGGTGRTVADDEHGSDSDDFSELGHLEPDSDDADDDDDKQFGRDEQACDVSESGL